MTQHFDILVIGGGPAGAVCGGLLAQGGIRVGICEAKAFPREKVCGELMGAGIRSLLDRMGILHQFDQHTGPPITQLWACPVRGEMVASVMPGEPMRAMGRGKLDDVMLHRAQQIGATVLQPCHVRQIHGNARSGFAVHTSIGGLHANTIILAHGAPSRPHLDGIPPHCTARDYVAFKAHFAHCTLPEDTIAIAGAAGIYAGLVKSSDGLSSLAFVAARSRLAHFGNTAQHQLNALCTENPHFARFLDHAERVGPWLAAGPVTPGIRRLYHDGRFFIGNAAGEVHALVGEGITLAMRSGALLADALLRQGITRPESAAAEYQSAWRRTFIPRYAAAQLFANIMMRPRLAGMAAQIMRRWPALLRASIRFAGK